MGEEGLSGVFKYQFLSLALSKKKEEKFLNEAIGCGKILGMYLHDNASNRFQVMHPLVRLCI